MLGTNELMNSRLSGSEAALATLAAKKIEKVAKPHVLIGGLGMGFTLRAALGAYSEARRRSCRSNSSRPSSPGRGIRWRRFFGESLSDPRVSIREADITEIIRSASWDIRRHSARRR